MLVPDAGNPLFLCAAACRANLGLLSMPCFAASCMVALPAKVGVAVRKTLYPWLQCPKILEPHGPGFQMLAICRLGGLNRVRNSPYLRNTNAWEAFNHRDLNLQPQR